MAETTGDVRQVTSDRISRATVTGGAGFIGSHLARELLRRHTHVCVLDDFSTGRTENLDDLPRSIELIRGDIRDYAIVEEAVRSASCVYHLAAISSVPLSVDNPLPTGAVNVTGTWNVLEASRRSGVKRVVFVSSASVYGARKDVPFKESMKLRGSSPYAATKLIGEQLCDLYGRLYDLEWVTLRLFSVYGPRQNPQSQYSSVIPAFATCLLSHKCPTIYGDGEQTRDFVYVTDVIDALVRAGERSSVLGEVINVGTGAQTSINRLLRLIQEALGVHNSPRYKPPKPGDDPRTCADVSKCQRLLGLSEATPLTKGLTDTLEWFKSAPAPQTHRSPIPG